MYQKRLTNILYNHNCSVIEKKQQIISIQSHGFVCFFRFPVPTCLKCKNIYHIFTLYQVVISRNIDIHILLSMPIYTYIILGTINVIWRSSSSWVLGASAVALSETHCQKFCPARSLPHVLQLLNDYLVFHSSGSSSVLDCKPPVPPSGSSTFHSPPSPPRSAVDTSCVGRPLPIFQAKRPVL